MKKTPRAGLREATRAPRPNTLVLALVLGLGGCGGASVEVQTSSAAITSDPLNDVEPSELFRRGVVLAQHGDFVRAEQYLLAARNRGFDEGRVIPPLMEVCVRASRLSAAIGYAEPYLESHPSDWPLRVLVGSIHLGLGHLGEARRHLETAARDGRVAAEAEGRPEPAEAHYLLGIVMREQAEIVEARTHFARYAELDPNGTHAEEVRAILAEPEPRQATPVPPPTRPSSVPVRLPNAAPSSATETSTAPTDATSRGGDS
jgi:tetratricopeptide (TPR) repeat protein